MEKYFGQQCQDDTLNQKFRELHYKLVDEIVKNKWGCGAIG